ncbi:MAG: zinc-ribbon domain-containing protein [Oscillospiraceae bacterium]|nr:zinc-ribbon domain-containing protein [Oscillospiraceae bacterium]
MICTKCGNNNPEGMQFCTNCRAPLGQQSQNSGFGQVPPQNGGFRQVPPQNGGFGQVPPQNGGSGQVPPQNGGFDQHQPFGMKPVQKTNTGVMKVAGGLVAVIALVIILILTLGSSPQKAANKLAKAVNSGNMEKVIESMLPNKAIKKLEKESGMSISSIASLYGAGSFNSVSNCKIKVKGKQDIDKDDVKEFKKEMKDNLGISVSKIEVREIEMTATAYGSTDKETMDAIFYKSGLTWYIIPVGSGLF